MLRIADQPFSITESAFSATIGFDQDGPFVWWDFDFRGKADDPDGLDWPPPHLSSHALIRLPELSSLAESEVSLIDDPNEEPNFMLYIYEHQPIYNCRIRFGSWRGEQINFTLNGTTDLYFNEQYQDKLPIHLEHTLLFQGVTVSASSLVEAEHWFDQLFVREQFHPGTPRDEGGFMFKYIGACT